VQQQDKFIIFLKTSFKFCCCSALKIHFAITFIQAMHKNLISLTLFVALSTTWFGQGAAAQNATGYESISIAQGLSQGMVFDMLQDKEGFIWVATKNGLNRYDGYGFKVFTNDPYNPHTLSSNTIVKLFEDSGGRIWAGTENAGINIYDKKSGQFYRIAYSAANPASLSGNGIKAITEMADGKILIATDVAGLNIVALSNNFFEKDAAPVITRLALPNNAQVYGMGKDKSSNVWIGGMDGSVFRFDGTTNSFIPLPNGQLLNNGYFTKDESILINNNLFLYDGKNVTPLFDTSTMPQGNIIFKPNSALWDNHHRELYYYDVSKWESGKPVQWNLQLPAATRLVYPFIIDRSGVLWSGSVGYGLRKYNMAGNKFKAQLPGYSVRFIIPVTANDIFLGDYAYGWRRVQNDSVTNNPFNKIAAVTQIDNFIIAKTGDYWIKSDNKGYFKYNPSSGKLIPYSQINYYEGNGDKQPMLEDSKGNLIFPGLVGVFTRLNTATEKIDSFTINTNAAKPMQPKAICTALYEDKQGVLWIGTPEGFVKLNFENNNNNPPQVKWFYNNNSNRNSLNYNHVSCFLDDPSAPDKYLWIATKGGGLNRLDKTTGDFFHLTAKDGLPDDVVYTLLPDDAGNIWGSTNKGIFCMSAAKNNNGNSWAFRNFTKASGLQDDEFNTGAYAKLPNGNLAFGGVNGVNIFNPKEILAKGLTSNIFITNILVGNQPVLPNDKTGVLQQTIEQAQSITLTHLQDILTLEFASLDFTAPGQNKYRYQLEGIDKDWIESGTRRTATYLHLPAGKYTFKVQGSNSQGIWSEKITELQITVLPPWWRTWWAYLIYLLLTVFGIRAYFKFKVNKAKLQSQLHYEQQEAKRIKELDTVKTQLYTNITHEFRTPLTVILGMAQQVKKDPDKYLSNGIDMIVRNGENLLNLVNEMLDLSKLEDGKMMLNLANGDVINFLRYIVESFQSLAISQQKQFHFLSDADELVVAYDAEKIRQIITNLLSNALKFTPAQGNVYVSISQEVAEKNDYTLMVLKVKDTGIGIPENQISHIFDRFYQLDNSHTRKAEGTGIGLALTKELVKLMSGTITVKSPAVGATKGTEFTITLPLQKVTMENVAAKVTITNNELAMINAVAKNETVTINNEHTAPATPLILLVEDNVDVVAYTASCLPEYKLAVGKDGREGFEIATGIIPDLIITDVMMPFVDGFEMCKKLRSDERTSHIPIIMLTAKADMQSKLEGLDKGADVYLEKPFHKEELLLRIKKLLELRKKLQQYYSRQIGITDSAETLSKEDIEPITAEKAEHEFVKKVREIVENNFTNYEFTVEQLCKLVFMSHSQLHRKLEALTGCSPNKFIRIIRLNKAKALLASPVLSIAGIAMDCGYNDPGYFARVFKQEMGVTPQEWRVGK
jgi:signal transduction histidine kinase/DNA-binding response OmpR family regulator/ligand-binding sensor domain-containing protein